MSIDGNTATTVGAQLDAAALKRVKADIDALAVKVFLGEHAVPNFDKALHLVSPPCVLEPAIDGQLILVPMGQAEHWHRELEALARVRWLFAHSFFPIRVDDEPLDLEATG